MTYGNNTLKIYLDGTEVHTETVQGNDVTESSRVNIGGWENSDETFTGSMDGKIDEISVWNRALTGAEVQNYMATALIGDESDLVGYWNFNESVGSALTDLSGNGNDGTISGASWSNDVPILPTPPVFGGNNSFSFDGDDDRVELPNQITEGLTSVTFMAWFNTTDHSGYSNIVQDDGPSGALFIRYNPDGSFKYVFKASQGWRSISISPPSYGVWHHVAMSWDGINIKAYLDGEEVGSSSGSGTMSGGGPIYIGNWQQQEGFSGKIDDVQYWNIALSESEIQAHMNTEPTGNEDGLIGYWNFNESEGSELIDLSGNGYNGTVYGATWSGDGAPVEAPVLGCTDIYAENYDSEANSDDGSCSGYPDDSDMSLKFNGNNLVRVTSVDGIPLGNSDRTLMAIFKVDDLSEQGIVSYGQPWESNRSFGITIHQGKFCASGWSSDLLTDISPEIGKWYSVAYTYSSDGSRKLYINGNLLAQDNTSLDTGWDGSLRLGQWTHETMPLRGNIANASLWSVVLSNNEIKNYIAGDFEGEHENLVANWKINAGAGDVLYDHSGGQNHGINYGATWSEETPQFSCTDPYAGNYDSEANSDDGSCSGYPDEENNSLFFSNNNVSVENIGDYSSKVTIMAWIKKDGSDSYSDIISGGCGNLLFTEYQNRLFFGSQCGDPISHDTYSTTEITDNIWHHVAATYNANGGSNNLKVYVDGQLEGQSTKTAYFNVDDFKIGTNNDGDGEFFNGYMDMMRIWNIDLTQEEIQENMYSDVPTINYGLLSDWRFNSGNGNMAFDHSGNGNHGTITGATWSDDVPYVGPEWFVSTSGDDSNIGSQDEPFATIQHAINAAHNGHIVLVSPGTYTENINYNGRNILVISEMGPSETIIDGGQNGSVVTFNSGETDAAALDGFTVTNGLTENGNGGGIFIDNSSPNIFNVIVENNHANSGGGIDLKGETQTVISNSIVRNNSAEWGAGIYCHSNSPTIENVVVSGNHATVNAGGVYAREYAYPIIINCTIVNNSTDGQGGGILTWFNSTVDVKNSIIRDNYPNELGHVSGGSVTLNYSNISGNHEGFSGSNNINVDPMFCNQSNNDFRIAQDSPCFGTGESGTDIGAMFDGDYCQESFVNNSLSFDGQDDWVDLNTMNDIVLNNMMYSFWINTDGSNNDNQCVINTRNGQIWIPINDVSVIHGADMINNNGGSPWQKVSSPSGTITPGNWHHIVFSVMGDNRELYVDNILVSSSSVEEGFNGSYPYSEIGSEGKDGRTNWFRGRIDEASIWSHGADVDMVEYLFNYKLKGDEEELIGYWDFDDGEGATLSDLSGNGNDGIINGASWDNYGAPIGPTGGENNEPNINGRLSGIISASSDNALLEGAHIIAISEDNSFSAEAYS
ncbi:DUF1565 domain-containing protein, partial [bacterium]|nr:DUF1565 domain-containing protein [bacterium]